MPVTQFNMKWAEAAGLVKFDFLGLKTLTVIEKARAAACAARHRARSRDAPARRRRRPSRCWRAATRVGVFQLEGAGMRDALRKLKPDRFEDIIAIVALYRPGPMDNIDSYVSRKHGREEPDYLHPADRADPERRPTAS